MDGLKRLVEELKKLRRYRVNVRVEHSCQNDRDADHTFYLTADYIKVQDLDKLLKDLGVDFQ